MTVRSIKLKIINVNNTIRHLELYKDRCPEVVNQSINAFKFKIKYLEKDLIKAQESL